MTKNFSKTFDAEKKTRVFLSGRVKLRVECGDRNEFAQFTAL